MAKDDAEAVETPKRLLVIQTDGDEAKVVQNTMGLFEAKAILESVLRWVCQQIDQRSRVAAAPQEPPPDEPDKPEDTTL